MAKPISRYSLVLETKDGELRYLKDEKTNSNKMLLEFIDRYTSQYRDLGHFLTELNKKLHFDFAPKEVYITYQAKGETKKLDLIFNDQDIKNKAISIINKKNNNQEALLDEDDSIIKLKNKLKAYALTRDVFSYIERTTRIFPYHVYDLLKQYRATNKMESTARQAELQQIEDSILYNLRDYKIYRKIRLWERVYENYKNKNKIPEDNEYIQMKLIDTFEQQQEQEKEVEFIDESAFINTFNNNEIKNKSLKELYDKYDGDIEIIVEILGIDFMDNLSEEDQQLSGYSDYKRRGR